MLYTFDFHNHSCLSPCASLENSPLEMVERALRKRIDLFALTDHNSALNTPTFAIECANAGIIPLFGIELNPFEEAHLLAIFSDPLTALHSRQGKMDIHCPCSILLIFTTIPA